ncbi:MAG: tRNA lysidine(34) synthetase TilS [Candidatus Wallbacteria bacterium]|nr:tRNA lysidine(34) synthetase TilS [Candidatus Wallbacteria bacterium]
MSARRHPLAERVAAWVNRLPFGRRRIVVAVSGGPDSMALLDVLSSLKLPGLVAAHVDHRLRGRQSAADRRLVERQCRRLGVPLEVRRLGDDEVRRLRQGALEVEARHLRYAFFEQTRRAHRCHRVATAHHRDDQVETFFLHLFRGAGQTGLGGMAPIDRRRPLFRPFLDTGRDEILAYLADRGVPFREDVSNRDLAHLRNRVRWKLLPGIRRQFGEAAIAAVARAMELLRADDEALEELGSRHSSWSLRPGAAKARGPLALRLAELAALPLALRRRVVRRALEELGGPEFELTLARVEAVLELAERSTSGKRLGFGGVAILREREALVLRRAPR